MSNNTTAGALVFPVSAHDDSHPTSVWMNWLKSVALTVLTYGTKSNAFADPKLYIGCAGVLCVWFTRDSLRSFIEIMTMIYIVSIDLIMLHITQFYVHPIWASLAVIVIYEAEMHIVSRIRRHYFPELPPQSGHIRAPPSGLVPTGLYPGQRSYKAMGGAPRSKIWTSTNVYTDFQRSFLRVLFVFLGQVVLVSYYLFTLSRGLLRTTNRTEFGYLYWVTGVVAVQFGTLFGSNPSSQSGTYFEKISQWKSVFDCTIYAPNPDDPAEPYTLVNTRSFFKIARCIMSFIINAGVRDFVMFTVPIFLMLADDEMDVFKDALAVMYLTALDDISEKTYVLVHDAEPSVEIHITPEYTQIVKFNETRQSDPESSPRVYESVIENIEDPLLQRFDDRLRMLEVASDRSHSTAFGGRCARTQDKGCVAQ